MAHLEPSDWEFQSTPPARGATRHTMGGGYAVAISIHAPREGGDNPHMV